MQVAKVNQAMKIRQLPKIYTIDPCVKPQQLSVLCTTQFAFQAARVVMSKNEAFQLGDAKHAKNEYNFAAKISHCTPESRIQTDQTQQLHSQLPPKCPVHQTL
jgi:hypothetical protein